MNKNVFERIAQGMNIWDRSDESTAQHREHVLILYGGFPSTTQFLERGNKNHNLCATNARKERAVNA
jgi:hypothetical protein